MSLFLRQPKPHAIVLDHPPIEKVKEYAKLATKLKVAKVPNVVTLTGLEVLAKVVGDLGLGFYNLQEVERYLNIIKPQFSTVVWKPASTTSQLQGDRSVYSRLIPVDALRIIDEVNKKMTEPVDWFVNDYEARNPDPFLAVCLRSEREELSPIHRDDLTHRLESFKVIYHWDEPGFGRI